MDDEGTHLKTECLYVCKCCLEDGELLDMWAEYINDDQCEIYGEMLIDCFNLKWQKISEDHIERICFTCIERLKHSAGFKAIIENAGHIKQEKKKHCRCCLQNKGKMKNLWAKTEIDGESEVLGEKFAECFGLNWKKPQTGLEYVCEICISKLQHTSLFKILIGISETKLAEHYNFEIQPLIETDSEELHTDELKEQAILKEDDQELYFEHYDSDDPEFEPEDAVMEPEESSEDEEFIPDSPKQTKRKSRNYDVEMMDKAVLAAVRGEMSATMAAQRYGVSKKTVTYKAFVKRQHLGIQTRYLPESHAIFVEEVKTILQYTNATPFKTRNNHFFCAYCHKNESIDDPHELREHTLSHSNIRLSRVEEFLKPTFLNEILRFDIHNLRCTQCNIKLETWNDMFTHMKETHDKDFKEAIKKAVPYILSTDLELKCALCDEKICGISYMDNHMNFHYDSYVCTECGLTFLTQHRLKSHGQNHKTGKFSCKDCSKVFTTKRQLMRHNTEYHNIENLSERCCEVCGKSFKGLKSLEAHMKRTHNKEKNQICTVCEKRFIGRGDLKKHMVTHTKERKYECVLCDKRFGTNWTLRQHYRIHPEVIAGKTDRASKRIILYEA